MPIRDRTKQDRIARVGPAAPRGSGADEVGEDTVAAALEPGAQKK